MGRADVYEKNFLDNNRIFADLVNGILYQGKQLILPEELQELDKELLYAEGNGTIKKVIPDKAKLWQGKILSVISVENQNYIDYRMVLRNMLSESIMYQNQWKQKSAFHKEKKDLNSTDEFLSGIKLEEKFMPVITIVVYYGVGKPWNGARTLYQLLDMKTQDEKIKPYVSNYKLNLFDINDYDNFEQFHTQLGTVFEVLRYSGDRKALDKRIRDKREKYDHLDKETLLLISALTGKKELGNVGQEKRKGDIVDMFKAWDDQKLEGIREGESRMANLVKVLLEQGKTDEVTRVVEEQGYREEMYLKLGI